MSFSKFFPFFLFDVKWKACQWTLLNKNKGKKLKKIGGNFSEKKLNFKITRIFFLGIVNQFTFAQPTK